MWKSAHSGPIPMLEFNGNATLIASGGADSSVRIDKLVQIIDENGYELNHLCYMSLYVRNMNDYAELNAVYVKTLNFANPPARVCVE